MSHQPWRSFRSPVERRWNRRRPRRLDGSLARDVTIGSALFSLDGLPFAPLPDADTIILRVTVGSRWGYAFLPVYELNMAYITGDTDVAEVPIDVDIR